MAWAGRARFPAHMPERADTPDWRDGQAYAPLLAADRSLHAWEWLRRDQAYRTAASEALDRGAGNRAERWGLHRIESPSRGVPDARPLWRAERHAAVLVAVAGGRAAAADAFDLGRFSDLSVMVRSPHGAEHLLLSDGKRTLRLDVQAGSILEGPVELRYLLAGFASAEAPLLTLRRLLALQRTGSFARSLHPRETRARRWILILRAFDALAAGASQRDIAEALLSREAAGPLWRSRVSSVRSQAQRLVRGARHVAGGGYWDLLR